MNYPGDFPPTPEERATYRLAANADWLARGKADGHAPGGHYAEYPDWEKRDEEMMERDNQRALAAAKKEIAAERAVHKCYICGRRDLPRYARVLGVAAAVLLGLRLWAGEASDAFILGYLGVAALGGAIAAGMHEVAEADDEETLRKKFNERPHS